MDVEKLNILLCLKALLAMIVIQSFAFGLSVMSGGKGKRISRRPGLPPGVKKK